MNDTAEQLDLARRIGFALAEAERDLGLPSEPSLPLDGKIEQVLHASAADPSRISAETYALLYRLHRHGRPQ